MASSLFSNDKPNSIEDLQTQVREMVNNKDPKEVFYEECKKRNVDPNMVLGLARLFGKK